MVVIQPLLCLRPGPCSFPAVAKHRIAAFAQALTCFFAEIRSGTLCWSWASPCEMGAEAAKLHAEEDWVALRAVCKQLIEQTPNALAFGHLAHAFCGLKKLKHAVIPSSPDLALKQVAYMAAFNLQKTTQMLHLQHFMCHDTCHTQQQQIESV